MCNLAFFSWQSDKQGRPRVARPYALKLLLALVAGSLLVGLAWATDGDWGDAFVREGMDAGGSVQQGNSTGGKATWIAHVSVDPEPVSAAPAPAPRQPIVLQNCPRMADPICFSGDGRILVTVTPNFFFTADGRMVTDAPNRGIILWDFKTGRRRLSYQPAEKYYDPVALSADGRTLVVTGKLVMEKFWEVDFIETSTLQRRTTVRVPISVPEGYRAGFALVWALSPKGTILATSTCPGLDLRPIPKEPPIRLWNWATGRTLGTFPGRLTVQSARFSGDGQYLLTSGYAPNPRGLPGTPPLWAPEIMHPAIILWDVAARKEKMRFKGPEASVWAIALSPDTRLAAAIADAGKVWLWETATGRLRSCWSTGYLRGWLAFSPDGKHLAATVAVGKNIAFSEARVVLWDLKGLEKRRPLLDDYLKRPGSGGYNMNSPVYSPDGKYLVVGWHTVCKDGPGGLLVIDTATGQPCLPGKVAPAAKQSAK